jgi:hypothetical protein
LFSATYDSQQIYGAGVVIYSEALTYSPMTNLRQPPNLKGHPSKTIAEVSHERSAESPDMGSWQAQASPEDL